MKKISHDPCPRQADVIVPLAAALPRLRRFNNTAVGQPQLFWPPRPSSPSNRVAATAAAAAVMTAAAMQPLPWFNFVSPPFIAPTLLPPPPPAPMSNILYGHGFATLFLESNEMPPRRFNDHLNRVLRQVCCEHLPDEPVHAFAGKLACRLYDRPGSYLQLDKRHTNPSLFARQASEIEELKRWRLALLGFSAFYDPGLDAERLGALHLPPKPPGRNTFEFRGIIQFELPGFFENRQSSFLHFNGRAEMIYRPASQNRQLTESQPPRQY